MYNTGNPIGSTAPKDFSDNAEITDRYVNDVVNETTLDRFGRSRLTIHGIEKKADAVFASIGFFPPVDYSSGLTVDSRNFTVTYNGVVYAAQPSAVPFTTGAWDASQWYPIQNVLNQKNLLVFDTYTEAQAAAATLPDGQVVDVAEENTRYDVSSGGLVNPRPITIFSVETGVIRSVQEKLATELVSVKDFGAIGDGVADDTSAAQTCLSASAGKTVMFPPGTYKLNTLNVPAKTFIFAYGAILDFSGADQSGLIFTDGGGMFGGTVVGIDGTVFGSGTGIHAKGVDNTPNAPTYIDCPTLRDVTVRDFRYNGILFEFARRGFVENCHIYSCGYSGIGGISVDYVNFDSNVIHDIAGVGAPDNYGVYLSSWENSLVASPRSTNCAVRNNTIYNVPNWEGIDTHGGTQISIIGNIVRNCRFGIAVVGGDTNGELDRGAKDITITGNTINGSNDGACITIAGTTSEHASGIVVSGNVLKDGGSAGNVSSGSIRAFDCYNLTITGNSIETPYVYGINLIQNIDACTVSGNTIVDARDNTEDYPACIAITSNNIRASIFGNTFGYVSSNAGTYVSVLSISIGAGLTGLEIDIGRNSFRGITSSKLTYNEGTSTGVNASGLTIASGRAQVALTNAAICSLEVTFPERFPVSAPRIVLTIAGSAVPGSVQKVAILETFTPSATGFQILARPYDLTTFGGSGTLEVDWVATA